MPSERKNARKDAQSPSSPRVEVEPFLSLFAEFAKATAGTIERRAWVLDRIQSGAPLQEILENLVRWIENQAPGMRCAILLAEPLQRRLRFVAAPSIPDDYKTGIEPYLRIAPNMGSCGTAAFLRKPVYTYDTATDPLWERCREAALRNGLQAIWSTPILSDDNDVLGTFAMYYGEPRLPSAENLQLIDMATQAARVAIQRKQDEGRLAASEVGGGLTDERQAQAALQRSAKELKALSRRLVELQESERRRLARELHDRVGQSLTALHLNLAILQDALSHDHADISARLQDSATLLESTVQAIENVVTDLRPPMLDDHGLRSALDWYARQFSARAGIPISVRASEPHERVAAEVEIALFRIAQEALNNVAKHARASSVLIALERRGYEYVMSVADDGVGMGDFELRPRSGLGMVTMRERAQAVGGRIEVEALPHGGTQLTVRIPMPAAFANSQE